MSNSSITPTVKPLLRLCLRPLAGPLAMRQWYAHWRALAAELESESALGLASQDVVFLKRQDTLWVGALVLGGPYSAPAASIFDLRANFKAEHEIKASDLDQYFDLCQELGYDYALCLKPPAALFSDTWPLKSFDPIDLALVNS